MCQRLYTPAAPTQHPAHPEAPAAPTPPPSTTLAYGPSDIPAPQPARFMAQRETPQGGHGLHHVAQQSPHSVVGEGKVIAVSQAAAKSLWTIRIFQASWAP